jgi:hypothetical protein
MMALMNAIVPNRAPLPQKMREGRSCVSEAWQSGLLHRAYLPADLWASKPLAGSRQFESDRFHHQTSGADGVGALSTPDYRPGDEPDATTVLSNIRLGGCVCQSRRSHPFNPKDELREHSLSRQANRDHRRAH